jgi:Mn-dependent DtxR family transcriptional regulator
MPEPCHTPGRVVASGFLNCAAWRRATTTTYCALAITLTASILAAAGVTLAFAPTHAPLLILPLFHRLTRPTSMEHPHRARLLDLARAEPGLLVADAARKLQVSYHTANHHMRMLKDFGHIEVVRAGRSVALYPAGTVPLRYRQPIAQLRRGPQGETLRLVMAHPGEGASQLARRMQIRKSSAHAKLKSLQRAGLIGMDDRGKYTATPAALEAMRFLQPGEPIPAT